MNSIMSRPKHKKTHPDTPAQPQIRPPRLRRSHLLALLAILALSVILNCIELDWGLPGRPWHSDSIAGTKSLQLSQQLFRPWTFKYPRLHFLVNAAVYKPFLDNWKHDPITVQTPSGPQYQLLNIERLSTLILASRIVTVIMAAGAVLAVFLTARILFRDNLAGLLAAAALACSQLFVFYSHLGNLDIPATFWFAWTLYFATAAVYIGKTRHYLLLGVFAALAVCTKDPVAGFVIGLAPAVWLALAARRKTAGANFKNAALAIFNRNTLFAVLAAAFCFALLNDLFTSPSAFSERMGHWLGGPGVAKFNVGFRGQWPMLKRTFDNFQYSLGWPLLWTVAAAAVYTTVRYRHKAAFSLLPLAVFYIIVVMKVQMTIPRYFLPVFPGLALLAGKALADLLTWRKIPLILRLLPVTFVYAASVLYCIGIDLEMATDSRYRAEKWCIQNVTSSSHIAALCPATYAPRLHLYDLNYSYRFTTKTPTDRRVLARTPANPPYVIMSQKWYTDTKFFDQDFRRAVFDGSLGYERVAHFENQYLYPKQTIFGFAGGTTRLYEAVSPKVTIFRLADRTPVPGAHTP